jgi:hypothetical protein
MKHSSETGRTDDADRYFDLNGLVNYSTLSIRTIRGRLGVMRMGFTLETWVASVNARLRERDEQLHELQTRLAEVERRQAEQRPKSQRGGRTAGQKRRAKVRADAQVIPDKIADIKRKGRATTDKAAARVYLAQRQPKAWPTLTDTEREKRVNAFIRRLSRLRKTADR